MDAAATRAPTKMTVKPCQERAMGGGPRRGGAAEQIGQVL